MLPGIFWDILFSLSSLASFLPVGSFLWILGGSLSLNDNQNLLSTALRRHTIKSTDWEIDLRDSPLQSFLGNSCSTTHISLEQSDWSCLTPLTMELVSHFSLRALGERTIMTLWHLSDSSFSWAYPEK